MERNLEYLAEYIDDNKEWLQTTKGDEVACISLENLQAGLQIYIDPDLEII